MAHVSTGDAAVPAAANQLTDDAKRRERLLREWPGRSTTPCWGRCESPRKSCRNQIAAGLVVVAAEEG